MKVVVIGANGFMGSSLTKRLLQDGNEVFAVYNKAKNNISPLAKETSFDAIGNINPTEIDAVFYLSGNFSNTHQELIQINCSQLDFISNYFNSAKLIYISSANVYGEQEGVITEDSCFYKPSLYGMAKLAGEFVTKKHKDYAILRLCYLYGPNLNNNSFLPRVLKQARIEKQICLFGQGNRKQDYLYIDDAIELCMLAMKRSINDVYLGASGKSYSNKFIAETIKAEENDVEIIFKGEETGGNLFYNPELTFDKLNWKPKTSIEEGLRATWNASINLW